MDSLLCDEVWLSSPPDCCYTTTVPDDDQWGPDRNDQVIYSAVGTNNEDFKQSLAISLEKELRYMSEPGYKDRLLSQNLFLPRFRAIQWFVKACGRLNLSCATAFNAANYLDRFISMNECHEWDHGMIELLSVACLSVASKFNETCAPSLHEIQTVDLDRSFQSITIQRMELVLLQALKWRLGSPTAFSYMELLTMNMKSQLQNDLSSRVTNLLLGAILDPKMVEYRPSTIAISALWCSLKELVPSVSDAHIASITNLFNQGDKDNLVKCHNFMEVQMLNPLYRLVSCGSSSYCCPSSPVTVLLPERIEIYENLHVHHCLFKMLRSTTNKFESTKKKRKRPEEVSWKD